MLQNNNNIVDLALPLQDRIKINIGLDHALIHLSELIDNGEISPASIDEVEDIISTLENIMDALSSTE